MDISNKKKFFVLGLGKSGTAVAQLLAKKGFRVVTFDDQQAARDTFVEMPGFSELSDWIEVATEENVLRNLVQSDCLVVSPGVSLDHPLVQKARVDAIEITGEIEVAYHFCSADIVGVTGTNGKSTVVSLLGDIFKAMGKRCVVAGNVGIPFSSVVGQEESPELVVLEISSFQLDTISDFKASVAVLLNVTADHLDRYDDSMEKYAKSKSRILNRADENTCFIYNEDDAICRQIASRFTGKKISFSSSRELESGVYISRDSIIRRSGKQVQTVLSISDFSPVGIHNLENAMAAIAAVTPFDIDLGVVREALKAYHPLPHRMELARIVGGVAYIDDSKATNVDATIKSVRSIDGPIVLIMGGLDKNSDYVPLAAHLGNVKRVVVIGEASDKIEGALSAHGDIRRAASMEEAVKTASDFAEAGDTVLLAPACASFDMFRDYKARGDAFKTAVNSL